MALLHHTCFWVKEQNRTLNLIPSQNGEQGHSPQKLRRDPKSEEVVRIQGIAQVSSAWSISEKDGILQLTDFHIWSQKFIEDRLSWRPKVPFTLLELRVNRLRDDLIVKNNSDFWGCFSFADVPFIHSLDALLETSVPVLTDKAFQEQHKELQALLAKYNVIPL